MSMNPGCFSKGWHHAQYGLYRNESGWLHIGPGWQAGLDSFCPVNVGTTRQ